MRSIYNKYSVQDVKELVEAYYGDSLFTTLRVTKRGKKIPKGSDVCFELMEDFLEELDKRGYEVVKTQK